MGVGAQTFRTGCASQTRAGLLRPLLEHLAYVRFSRRREEGQSCKGRNDAVKVDTGPDLEGFLEAKDNKGCSNEVVRGLSRQPGDNVVVFLAWQGLLRRGIKKERTNITAIIYKPVSIALYVGSA
jgi:hypothetical protein